MIFKKIEDSNKTIMSSLKDHLTTEKILSENDNFLKFEALSPTKKEDNKNGTYGFDYINQEAVNDPISDLINSIRKQINEKKIDYLLEEFSNMKTNEEPHYYYEDQHMSYQLDENFNSTLPSILNSTHDTKLLCNCSSKASRSSKEVLIDTILLTLALVLIFYLIAFCIGKVLEMCKQKRNRKHEISDQEQIAFKE